jgi:hypothetical protein
VYPPPPPPPLVRGEDTLAGWRGIRLSEANPMPGVFRNIDPPPPHRPACVYPPPLVRGGGHTRWGGGGSIVRKTPDTALYSIYVRTLWCRGIHSACQMDQEIGSAPLFPSQAPSRLMNSYRRPDLLPAFPDCPSYAIYFLYFLSA